MTELVFQGPFLTRNQAARRAGVPRNLLPDRPDLLRVGGEFLEEVYFAFQFDEHGVRPGIGQVVTNLRRYHPDDVIADWLVSPNVRLAGANPLQVLNEPVGVKRVLAAAERDGPSEEPISEVPPPVESPAPPEAAPRATRVRRRRHTAFPHPA